MSSVGSWDWLSIFWTHEFTKDKKNMQYLIVYKLESVISHFNSFFVGESLPAKKKV